MSEFTDIIDLYEERADALYGGEVITQMQHALQAAALAEEEGAPAEMIVAALLHDVGHLLNLRSEDATKRGVDLHHQNHGANYLARRFKPEVAEPVRMHVDAKRYLCATIDGYQQDLSDESKRSLELQGGPMTDEEQKKFLESAHAQQAIALRRLDDRAKRTDAPTPQFEHFLKYLSQCSRS